MSLRACFVGDDVSVQSESSALVTSLVADAAAAVAIASGSSVTSSFSSLDCDDFAASASLTSDPGFPSEIHQQNCKVNCGWHEGCSCGNGETFRVFVVEVGEVRRVDAADGHVRNVAVAQVLHNTTQRNRLETDDYRAESYAVSDTHLPREVVHFVCLRAVVRCRFFLCTHLLLLVNVSDHLFGGEKLCLVYKCLKKLVWPNYVS